MKFFFIFLTCCLLHFGICHSQITITQADMPDAGDTLRVSYSADTLDPAFTDSTCANVSFLWDYSYLTPNAQWLRKFDSPSTFTFPFNVLFNSFNTSYGQEQYTPDSIPIIGLQPDDAYNFYKESSTKYKQIGAGLTINSLPLPFAYNPHDTIYRFPLNCGDRDTSDAAYGVTIPGVGYYGQKIHRVNYSDGTGTLITPFGSFNSLRVRSLITVVDTFADTTGNGFSFARPLQYEYKWLVSGGRIPYLQVNANDVAGFPVVTQISYRDSMRSGVTQIGIDESRMEDLGLRIYPNPVHDYALLQYTLDTPSEVKIELYDFSGRKIKSFADEKQTAGKHVRIVNVAGLPPQLYFIKISSLKESSRGGIQIASGKLSVTR